MRMAISKVIYGGNTLIDLTGDTVTAQTLLAGVTAHDKAGNPIVGTASAGGEKYGATADTFIGNVDANGVLQAPSRQTDLVFAGVTDVATSGLEFAFEYMGAIRSVSFPALTGLSASYAIRYAFRGCANLASTSFPTLTTVSGNNAMGSAFSDCTSLTSVSFPNLASVAGTSAMSGAFNGCTSLTSVSFPALQTIGTTSNYGVFASAFYNTQVSELRFPELTACYNNSTSSSYGAFCRANRLQKIYLPKLSVFTGKYNFNSCSALTEIHFGAANQAAIEASEGYPTLWGRGAGNATVFFDL